MNTRTRIWRPISALALATLVTAAAGPAAANARRYTTVFEEVVDGAKLPTSAAELQVISDLVAAGITFIDESQSRKIRSVTDAGTLLGGTISPVITSLDADVIVAAICRVSRIDSQLLGEGVHRFDASIQAKVIATDTGQVLGAFQVRGEALDFVPSQAAEKAAQAAGKALADKVKAAGAKVTDRIELVIEGIPSVSMGEAVVTAVKKLPGVTSVRVLQAGRGVTKLEITAKDKTSRDLALALDGAGGAGVAVFGYTARAIKAGYNPAAALSLPVVVTPLARKQGSKGDAWRGRVLASLVGTSLTNAAFLSFPQGPEPSKASPTTASMKAAGLDPATTLLVEGDFVRDGDALTLAVRLRVGLGGPVLLAGTRSCTEATVSACASELGDSLTQQLLPAVLAKRQLLGGKVDVRHVAKAPAPGEGARKPVVISTFTVENIYPARLNAYRDKAIGTVRLKNQGREEVTGLVVSTSLPGFTSSALDTTVADLAPGEERDVPLKVVLDRAALASHDENQPAVLRLAMRYDVGDYRIEDARSQALVVYDRNTLNWKQTPSVAAFVTPRTADVQRLAKALAASQSQAARADRLGLAAALFEGLGRQNVRYQRDPVNPYGAETLDYVQFPEQTLTSGSGDCDDLAVLYAAFAEALGLRTLLVTTPGHVFVAVDTGLPAQAATTVSLDLTRTLLHDGTTWLPLETTLLGRPLAEAWAGAAKELARWAKEPRKVELVDLRQAWQDYAPVSLVAATTAAIGRPVQAQEISAAVDATLGALAAARAAALDEALAAVDAALAKRPTDGQLQLRKGHLLALTGDGEGARKALQAATKSSKWAAIAENNLGNLELAAGKTAEARGRYRKALDKGGAKDPRILVNAALAAYAAGDEDAFAEHVFSCLELGAEDLVLGLGQAGVKVDDGTRGADDAGLASRDLRRALQRAYERKRRAVPTALGGGKVRASDAGAASPSLGSLLYWL